MTKATTVTKVTEANPCATCGACCRSYAVPIFGYDLWLLCTRQRLSPEQFCLIYPESEPRAEAFCLEAGGQHYSLALDKKGRFALKKPCIFLMELPGGPDDPHGNPRCGVYDSRPVACHTYPMSLWSGVVAQRTQTLCPPDSWPLAAVTNPRWLVSLQRLCMALDIYGEVVARWNARVNTFPDRRYALPEYFSFLLNVYDRLDSLRSELGDGGMAAVEVNWPSFPRPAYDTQAALGAAGDVPWLRYFIRARHVIDSFYPNVDPQPPALRSSASPERTPPATPF